MKNLMQIDGAQRYDVFTTIKGRPRAVECQGLGYFPSDGGDQYSTLVLVRWPVLMPTFDALPEAEADFLNREGMVEYWEAAQVTQRTQAIMDVFTQYTPCSHEHDCCGCVFRSTATQVTPIDHSPNLYLVQITHYRNL